MKVLDAFCGVGGATRGYQLAGAHVTGVDIAEQPRYCGDDFVQGDAVQFILDHGREFDFIHTSPPCQSSSALTKGTNKGRVYPQLIPPTRAALQTVGQPCVIENVSGAPIRKDVTLCGEMFGLQVIRHRHFEVQGWLCPRPVHLSHRGRVAGMRHGEWFTGPYFAVYGEGGGKGTVEQWRQAMGIDWTWVRKEIAEAIPPAYAQWMLEQFDARLRHQSEPGIGGSLRPSGNLSALTHIRSVSSRVTDGKRYVNGGNGSQSKVA